jgi:putative peptide zinc metalloprotease protein
MSSAPKRTAPSPSSLRRDLVVTVQERAGRRVAVLKDPVAHRFHELDAEDYEIVRRLDATRPLAEQMPGLRAATPGLARLDTAEFAGRVARLSAELRTSGLADGGAAEGGAPSPAPTATQGWRRALRAVSSVLFIRIRLGDPTRLLDATRGWFGFAFTRGFPLGACLFFAGSALVFFAVDGSAELDARWFGSAAGLLTLYLGIAALKFIHEAAHAVTVRRHGGAVHEVGMMLMAGLPLFYVEASDSYLFPKKSQRMTVAGAGIVAELLVAAILVWPWLALADGFLRQWLLNLILIASVSTVLFNGNPLMRFDGYYVLADWLDMPSLRERARRFLALKLESVLLGTRPPELRDFGARERRILGAYGVASQVYLVLIVFGLWLFLARTLEPLGLKWAGDLLMTAWVASALIWPLAGFARGLAKRSGASAPRRRRALAISGGLALAGVALLFVPAPRWVDRTCELKAKADTLVRTAEDGMVKIVLFAEGDTVRAGDEVARLENRELSDQASALASRLALAEATLHAVIATGPAEAVGAARDERSAAQAQLDALSRRLESLVLRAGLDGTVATRDLARATGRRLKAGEVFCVLRPPRLDEFIIPLSEKEARLVQDGARVRLRVRAYPERSFTGEVVAAPLRAPRPNEAPADPGQAAETHLATVRISDADAALRIGLTGRVRIECGRAPIGRLLLEKAWDFLRLDLRMR